MAMSYSNFLLDPHKDQPQLNHLGGGHGDGGQVLIGGAEGPNNFGEAQNILSLNSGIYDMRDLFDQLNMSNPPEDMNSSKGSKLGMFDNPNR